MDLPNEIWIDIIKNLDIVDIINLCKCNKRLNSLCETNSTFIFKEILRVKKFYNFDKFNVNMFTNFVQLDKSLRLNSSNLLLAYEMGLMDVVEFLLDNLPVFIDYKLMHTQRITQHIHAYWCFYMRDLDVYHEETDILPIQENLIISIIRFNIKEAKNTTIPDNITTIRSHILSKLYYKIDFQSMANLYFHISIMKSDWNYIQDSIDIIGLQYYEDAY
jgi:hypothetical protein